MAHYCIKIKREVKPIDSEETYSQIALHKHRLYDDYNDAAMELNELLFDVVKEFGVAITMSSSYGCIEYNPEHGTLHCMRLGETPNKTNAVINTFIEIVEIDTPELSDINYYSTGL